MIKQTIKTTLCSLLLVIVATVSLDATDRRVLVPSLRISAGSLSLSSAMRGGQVVTFKDVQQFQMALNFPYALHAIKELTVPLCKELNLPVMADFCNLSKLTICLGLESGSDVLIRFDVLRKYLPAGAQILLVYADDSCFDGRR